MLYGCFGLRQVLVGLRYHFCRGPASLYRVPFRVCPPVSGSDTKARCGSDYRPFANSVLRTEGRRAESQVDCGHDDGNLRLPSRAVRTGWRAALCVVRNADRHADTRWDCGSDYGAGRRDTDQCDGPDCPREKRGVSGPICRSATGGLSPCTCRRTDRAADRDAATRTPNPTRYRPRRMETPPRRG